MYLLPYISSFQLSLSLSFPSRPVFSEYTGTYIPLGKSYHQSGQCFVTFPLQTESLHLLLLIPMLEINRELSRRYQAFGRQADKYVIRPVKSICPSDFRCTTSWINNKHMKTYSGCGTWLLIGLKNNPELWSIDRAEQPLTGRSVSELIVNLTRRIANHEMLSNRTS